MDDFSKMTDTKPKVLDRNEDIHYQWSGRILTGGEITKRILGIITGWDPSACKSNQFHVHILRFSFIKLGYIFYKFLQNDW